MFIGGREAWAEMYMEEIYDRYSSKYFKHWQLQANIMDYNVNLNIYIN